jgi:hypothetical protein
MSRGDWTGGNRACGGAYSRDGTRHCLDRRNRNYWVCSDLLAMDSKGAQMSADPHPLPGSHRQSQKLCCQCCYFPFGFSPEPLSSACLEVALRARIRHRHRTGESQRILNTNTLTAKYIKCLCHLLVFLTSDSRCRKSKPRGSCHFRPGPCKYSSLLGSRSGLARAMALKKEFVNQREI